MVIFYAEMYALGLFDGEHIFELVDLGDGTTKFLHREQFRGILVPLLWKQLDTATRQAFVDMNTALKQRAEQQNEPTQELLS